MSVKRSCTHIGQRILRHYRFAASATHRTCLSSLRPPRSSLCPVIRFSSQHPSHTMSDPAAEVKQNGGSTTKPSRKDKKAAKADPTTTTTTPAAAPDTPAAASVAPGTLKDFSQPIADAYNIRAVESHWDAWWEAQGLYRPLSDSEADTTAEPFVIVIPPPNVTGTLHLGHALTCSVEDAIVRYQRMRGRNVLWLPGTDHAGIATQVVVEKKLMREEHKSRHDLGREAFIKEVWKWKHANGNRINQQIRRLGASVDWSREAFTMDDNLSRAVQHAFITLHERGLIYRSNRLVNWSCALRTAISSIEVDHMELEQPTMVKVPNYAQPIEFGVIHSFAYKVAGGGPNDEVVVATTRIETMLGDVAVAVHPNDERYTALHGKLLVHPFIEGREVRIVTDGKLVDMAFGTGAVKVTPAHDPNDFDCGVRNGLAVINIFTDDGLINENGGVRFVGMKRFEARQAVIEQLTALGLYRGKAANKMSLGVCSRSKDIVEPVVRPQWWVNCQSMAARAVDKVKREELRIVPAMFEKVWYQWLENIQDWSASHTITQLHIPFPYGTSSIARQSSVMEWCISRQLWWGHRIPAYHVSVPSDPSFATHSTDENTFWVCGKSPADALLAAHTRFPNIPTASIVLRQDEDVLDTWFSAGLFPFSTMGWPQQSAADLARFYPGSLLETGHDILFFWVARMVMMGLELTDSLPFTTVYLHAMVRDKFGRKMSKSLGNVVDPLDVIDGITLQQLNAKLLQGNLDPSEVTKATEGQRRDFPDGITACGADALRFGLLAYSAQGRDVNLDIQRVVAYSHFGNKLWQATRFALLNFDPSFQKPQSLHDVQQLVKAAGGFGDRFILSRLAAAVQRANAGFEQYQFAEVTTAVYNFWLYELCDVYLELIKPVVKSTDTSPVGVAARQSALAVLYTCLRSGLLLLHPLMPFISEELWHRLPQAMTTEHQKSGTGGRQHCGSIMVELYPTVEAFSVFVDTDMEQLHGVIEEIAKSARSTRATLGLTRKRVDMYLLCSDQQTALQLSPHIRDIGTLSIANAVNILTADQRSTLPAGCTSSVVSPTIELFIPLKGLVDFGAELVKLEKQLTALQAAIQLQKEKMAAAGYEKTKQEVQARNADKLAADESEVVKLQASIDNFNGLMSSEEVAAYEVQKIVIRQADAERVRVGMEKIVPVGGDETKLNKKIAGKYAELKSEYGELLREIERLKIKQQQQSQKS